MKSSAGQTVIDIYNARHDPPPARRKPASTNRSGIIEELAQHLDNLALADPSGALRKYASVAELKAQAKAVGVGAPASSDTRKTIEADLAVGKISGEQAERKLDKLRASEATEGTRDYAGDCWEQQRRRTRTQ